MKLTETRKENELYFQGAFWIVGNSLNNILNGDFKLVEGSRLFTDYYGDYIVDDIPKKSTLTHKHLWSKINSNHEWDYYPRGRVAIDQGTAYIHLNSKCATKEIINSIIDRYCIDKLRIVLDYNNENQDEHYNFKLE